GGHRRRRREAGVVPDGRGRQHAGGRRAVHAGHGPFGRSAAGPGGDAPEAAGILTVVTTEVPPAPLSSLAARRSISRRISSAGVSGGRGWPMTTLIRRGPASSGPRGPQ